MGILAEPLDFIRQLALPKGFSVCELGDQYVTSVTPHYLARKFYEELGCGRYESVDGNGRGTKLADLNTWRPLQEGFGKFDLVTDFGTGEHIFDQAWVFKTWHDLCEVGGCIVFDRPTAGYDTHCFYLIKEELIRDLAAANRYKVVRLEFRDTARGRLIRGVLHRRKKGQFVIPQQGRYKKSLRVK